MAVFAVAAELPYNLCFGRTFFTLEHNNVIFTHLLGLLMLICLKKYAEPASESGNLPESRAITAFIIAGFCIPAGSVCQAIGNPLYSLIVSVCRQLVVLIPAAWLLSQTGNLNMVWFAFPIAEMLSLLLSSIFLRRTMRKADAVMAAV